MERNFTRLELSVLGFCAFCVGTVFGAMMFSSRSTVHQLTLYDNNCDDYRAINQEFVRYVKQKKA